MLKIIAMVTMLVDHIGATFLEQYPIYRVIGRISMPIYAYLVAQGMVYTTKHKSQKYYILRLLLLGVLSQAPYQILFKPESLQLNICFEWTIAAAIIWGTSFIPQKYALCVLPIAVVILWQSAFSYQFLAVGFSLIFWLFLVKKDLTPYRYGAAIVLISLYVLKYPSPIHYFHLVGFVLIDILRPIEKKNKVLRKKIPKEIAYGFYPVHMLILAALRAAISS